MDELPHSRLNLIAHIPNYSSQSREPSAIDVGESLPTRIRSLLLSRNLVYPPRRPCPTPKLSALKTELLDNRYSPQTKLGPDLDVYAHVKKNNIKRRNSSRMTADVANSHTTWTNNRLKSGFDLSVKDSDEDSEVWSAFLSLDEETFERAFANGRIPVSKFISDHLYAKSRNRRYSRIHSPELRSGGKGFSNTVVRDEESLKSLFPTITSLESMPPRLLQETKIRVNNTHLEDSPREKNAGNVANDSPRPTPGGDGVHLIEYPSAVVPPLNFRKRADRVDGPRFDTPSSLALDSDHNEPIDLRMQESSNVQAVNGQSSFQHGGQNSVQGNSMCTTELDRSDLSSASNLGSSSTHENFESRRDDKNAASEFIPKELVRGSPACATIDQDDKKGSMRQLASSGESGAPSTSYTAKQETTPLPYPRQKGRDAFQRRPNHDSNGPTTRTRSQSRDSAPKSLLSSPSIGSVRIDTSPDLIPIQELPLVSDNDLKFFHKSQAERASTSPPNFGSSIQQELNDILQRVKRSNTAVLGFRYDKTDTEPPASWDLKTAKIWITQLVKHSLCRDQHQDRDRNLTSRPLRKCKSYFDRYAAKKASLKSDGIFSIDGKTPGMTSEEIESHAERYLLSLKSDSLERVIKELETVIGDALQRAAKTSDEYEPSIYKELQDIANCLQSTDNPFHKDYSKESDVTSGQMDMSGSSKLPDVENVPVARMKRIQKENSDSGQEESRLRTNEYHRALLKMCDEKLRPMVLVDRAEYQQRAAPPKESAIPDFLRDSNISVADTEMADPKVELPSQLSFPTSTESEYESKKSVPLMFAAEHSRRQTEEMLSQEPPGLRRSRTTGFSKSSDPRVSTNRTIGVEAEMNPDNLDSLVIGAHDFALSPRWESQKTNVPGNPAVPPARPAPEVPFPERQTSVPDIPQKSSSTTAYQLKTGETTPQDVSSNDSRPSKKELVKYMKYHLQPPVLPRESSIRRRSVKPEDTKHVTNKASSLLESLDLEYGESDVGYVAEFENNNTTAAVNEKGPQAYSTGTEDLSPRTHPEKESSDAKANDISLKEHPQIPSRRPTKFTESDLHKHRHFSLRGFRGGVALHRSHKRAPIARDWSNRRKRFAAMIACISTALVGIMIGIYAGEAPALQYSLVDEHHRFIYLGNVLLYLGLAASNIMFWPLPILHGRKPYTLSSLVLLLPCLFPQAMSVMVQRTSSDTLARVGLLGPRFLGGFALGFANINFFGVLLDVFGASLMSGNPHQEVVDEHDARRHGGGMGVWLGIWTWCYMGSIGTGFLIGAMIAGNLNVTWGFWICIFITIFAIILNVIAPETRRSAYRRSMAEVRSGSDVSRRIARGEIMMHLYSTGPKHWYQEMVAGWVLSLRMIRQPGFLVLALYQAWIYGQVVMVMILLGALTSKYYHLQAWKVALCVAAFPLGALVAIPFQKASFFSRARHHPQRSDSMTFKRRVVWTSHMVRRTLFMVSLPLAGVAYTLASRGPPSTPLALPVLFASIVGLLSNLALSECQGLTMECFDTSDLQPGMTGRPRNLEQLSESERATRTNFSCFPRVTAGFAIVQSLSFAVAAAATAWGGSVERNIGAHAASGGVAGVLGVLTVLLVAVLARFRTVQVVPTERVPSVVLRGPGQELPVVIGNPSGTERKVNLLEMGGMTRWTEIRRRNKLL